MALACGQNEGLIFRFRDLLLHEAVDYVQPNVVISGGFTQSAEDPGLARRLRRTAGERRGWPYHNMHLQAGVANGGLVELHYLAVELCPADLSRPAEEPKDGWLTLPDAPGLGFEPDRDASSRHRKDIAGGHTLIAGGQEPRARAIWRRPRWLLEGRTTITGAQEIGARRTR